MRVMRSDCEKRVSEARPKQRVKQQRVGKAKGKAADDELHHDNYENRHCNSFAHASSVAILNCFHSMSV